MKKIPNSHLIIRSNATFHFPGPHPISQLHFAVTTQKKVQALEIFAGHQEMVSVPTNQLIKRLKDKDQEMT